MSWYDECIALRDRDDERMNADAMEAGERCEDYEDWLRQTAEDMMDEAEHKMELWLDCCAADFQPEED